MLQTNQKITEEYTKLKTPKGTLTSDYIILHQRKGKSRIVDHNITSELLSGVIKGQGQGFHKHDPQQLSKETKGKNPQVLNSLSTNCIHLALATWNLSGNPDYITSTVKRGWSWFFTTEISLYIKPTQKRNFQHPSQCSCALLVLQFIFPIITNTYTWSKGVITCDQAIFFFFLAGRKKKSPDCRLRV